MVTFQLTQLLKGREGYRQRANGDLERVEGSLVYVIDPATEQPKPESRGLSQNPVGNEYDYKCKGFELKAVPRSEFEALKRFGDYTELQDGMLMRVEGDKEFRIYCEDVEGCAIGVLTEGVLSLLSGEFDEPCPRDRAREERESYLTASSAWVAPKCLSSFSGATTRRVPNF